MNTITSRILRVCRGLALAVLLVGTSISAAFLATHVTSNATPKIETATPSVEPETSNKVRRVGLDGVVVPTDVVRNMGLRTVPISEAVRPIVIPPLQGYLAHDNDLLARVHTRFPGEVISFGTTDEMSVSPGLATAGSRSPRALKVGDRVRKGDLLAVVWSKDLGEKKSELLDAVSKFRSDELILRRLQEAYENASVAERSVRDAERVVESDRIAVDRVVQTLVIWKLTDDEIAEVRSEADRRSTPDSRRPDSSRWARVEVRSPQDGVVLEKNVVAGDIVDTTADLFRIGDLAHLVVWAHVYEEDLPLLQSLPQPISWTLSVASRPGVAYPGVFERIGAVIDPYQHTALVTGRVENPNGSLKVGQFVTASITLPPPAGQIELPAESVVEDGRISVVFVQPVADEQKFVRVPVEVARRFRDGICVRTNARLRPGDRIVTSGALLLREAMDELPVPPQ